MSRSPRRPHRSTRALFAAFGLSLALAACDSNQGETPTLEVFADDSSGLLTVKDSDGVSFLERVVAAPRTVSFEGVRRLTFAPTTTPSIDDEATAGDSEFSNPGHRTVYLEQVWADGEGHFTVTPLDLIEPFLPVDEADQFLVLQQQRERFLYLHRDFQIRNLALFQENWSLEVLDDDAEFLGRPALLVNVQRKQDVLQERSYHVTFDAETGLVLSYTELDDRGRTVSLVTYESLTVYESDASLNVSLESGVSAEEEGGGAYRVAGLGGAADSSDEASTEASTEDSTTAEGSTAEDTSEESTDEQGSTGASPVEEDVETPLLPEDLTDTALSEATAQMNLRGLRAPAHPPKGFRLVKQSVLTDPFGSRWLRLIYSDGVEELFVAIEFDRHPSSQTGVQTEVLALDGRDGDVEQQREDWVEIYSSGSWSIAQGEFHVTSIYVVGKMHHRDLLVMLESTLH